MAESLKKKRSKNKAIAIIGDGAMTAGMALTNIHKDPPSEGGLYQDL